MTCIVYILWGAMLCYAGFLQGEDTVTPQHLFDVPLTDQEKIANVPLSVDEECKTIVWFVRWPTDYSGPTDGTYYGRPLMRALFLGSGEKTYVSVFEPSSASPKRPRSPIYVGNPSVDGGDLVYNINTMMFLRKNKTGRAAFIRHPEEWREQKWMEIYGMQYRKGSVFAVTVLKTQRPHAKERFNGRPKEGYATYLHSGGFVVPQRSGHVTARTASEDTVPSEEGWRDLGKCIVLDIPWHASGVIVFGGQYDESKRRFIDAQEEYVLSHIDCKGSVVAEASVPAGYSLKDLMGVSNNVRKVVARDGAKVWLVDIKTEKKVSLPLFRRVLRVWNDGRVVGVVAEKSNGAEGEPLFHVVEAGLTDDSVRSLFRTSSDTAVMQRSGSIIYLDGKRVMAYPEFRGRYME